MVDKIAELRLGELLGYCAIIAVVLSTFLEVSKIKINPWSALGRARSEERRVGKECRL